MLRLRLDLEAFERNAAAAFAAQAIAAVFQGLQGVVDARQVGCVNVGERLVHLAAHIALHDAVLVGGGWRKVLAVLLHLVLKVLAHCQQPGLELLALGGGQCFVHGVLLRG